MPQQKSHKCTTVLGLAVLSFFLAFDQWSKWFVFEKILRVQGDAPDFMSWAMTPKSVGDFFAERENFENIVLTPFLNVVMVWNQGISFGLFSNSSENGFLIFVILSLLITFGLLIWLYRCTSPVLSLAIGLITGGALGNVFDRIRFGAVADFIDFHYNNMHWPAFNVADICIVCGAFLIILHSMFWDEDQEKAPIDV